MWWMAALATGLLVLGSALALAETSLSRMTRVRAAALGHEQRRHAARLEAIERDPAPYLNALYLSGVVVQNGAVVLVAMLAARWFQETGIAVAAALFTLAYFVVVEAMAKTFGIQHGDRAALAVAPVVWALGRCLSIPTRALIGLANVLLPGKGLAHGPFVSEEEIRSMADVGHQEGSIEESEKQMIHSVFHFGDRVVRELMVPRPDVVAIDLDRAAIRDAHRLAVEKGFTRIPAYRGTLDQTEGIVHGRDLLAALLEGRPAESLAALMRPAHFVPGSKRAADLLRDMQRERFHTAMVTDEYGTVVGLVTLENLIEELVGAIAEEHEHEAPDVAPLAGGGYRLDASVTVSELNELLGTALPDDRWNTVGGLMFGTLGTIPAEGQHVVVDGYRFTAERVTGRRVTTVRVAPEASAPELAMHGARS